MVQFLTVEAAFITHSVSHNEEAGQKPLDPIILFAILFSVKKLA